MGPQPELARHGKFPIVLCIFLSILCHKTFHSFAANNLTCSQEKKSKSVGQFVRYNQFCDVMFTRFLAEIRHMFESLSKPHLLTRAPLGYFYNAPHWGGGGLFRAPPLISETTGPILKIQAAFESPGKTVKGKQILLISGSRVTSQVRSKSKCSTFRAW